MLVSVNIVYAIIGLTVYKYICMRMCVCLCPRVDVCKRYIYNAYLDRRGWEVFRSFRVDLPDLP